MDLHKAVLALAIATATVPSAAARAGDGFETFGDVMRFALPAAALGISAAKRDGDGALMFAASGVPTFALTYGLKAVVHEERPDGSGDDAFIGPHGCRIRARPTSTTAWLEVGAPGYLLAALVGGSRIEADKHYFHDVLASVVIANVSAYFFTDPQNDRVFLFPYCDSRKRSFGIVASMRF
jgi:hypothetical protein